MVSDTNDPDDPTGAPAAPSTPNLLPIPNMPGGYYDPATGDLWSNGQKVGGHYDAGSNTLTDPNGATFTVGTGRQIPGAPTGANTGILTPTTTPKDPGVPPPPTPPPAGGPPPTTGSGTGTGTGGAPVFNPPGYTPPPAMQAPTPFSYANFVAPDPNELNNDPFYKYTLGQEQSAIQRSAAARGVLNTGGTINDLLTNANDIASSGYQNLWGRRKAEYDTNRGNAFDSWKANYGVGKDVYDTNAQNQYVDPFKFGYQGQQDRFNSQIHNYDLSQQYGWYGKLFDFQKDQDLWHRKMDLIPYS